MPDITNPQVVKFCNERLRHFADYEIGKYREAKTLVAYAMAGDILAVTPNTADLVLDGSEVDGRGRISGAALHACIADALAYITAMDAASGAMFLRWLNVSVNPK